MQPLQEYFCHTSYLFKISGRCWHTLKKHSLPWCTNFPWGHSTFLQISMHPHPNCRWTLPLIDRCANTGPCTANRSIWSIQLGNNPWKLLIMLWHRKQIFGHNTSWNKYSWDFREPVLNNGQFCIPNTPLIPLANRPMCLSSLYAKVRNSIQKRCSLQVKKANSISIPTSIAPNVWIITSSPAAAPARITLICPGETSRVITPQRPIHILRSKPACSATS